MSTDWRKIWGERISLGDDLPSLIAADGFDGESVIGENDWMKNLADVATMLNMRQSDTIYEVGCGAYQRRR